jgi:hypothetical protein
MVAARARAEPLIVEVLMRTSHLELADALADHRARTLTETLPWALPARDRLAVTASHAGRRAEALRAGELSAPHLAWAAAAISAQRGCFGDEP